MLLEQISSKYVFVCIIWLNGRKYIAIKIINRQICYPTLSHNSNLFLDALKELKKAKSQNESSAALEEMVSKLSEEKLKSANDIDNYKRSGLKLNEELEQLNNKYQDLEADFSIKQRYSKNFILLCTVKGLW